MNWTHLVCVIGAWLVGAASGWLLKTRRAKLLGLDERRVKSVLLQVQELSHGIVSDVGKHVARVEEINQDLISRAGDKSTNHYTAIVDLASQLVAADKRLQTRLTSAEQQLSNQAEQFQVNLSDARLDTLTALPNQRSFQNELNRRFAEWQRTGATFALVVMELDNIAQVKEQLGHETV
ncbi:MAG TPA: GGDEF domain-containing protein, partial [Pirellulales bacterium]|nr:GGDEF domain-containing protein [Pirellulales bacterium]